MSDRIGVDVKLDPDSLKKLDKVLVGLGKQIGTKIVRRGLQAGAKVILTEVKKNVPVDTGTLKKKLKVRATKRSRKGAGRYIRTPTREELGISEKGNSYYPASIEYGWQTAWRFKGSDTIHRGRRVPARSFMRKGFNESVSKAKEIAIRNMWADIKDFAVRGKSALVGARKF